MGRDGHKRIEDAAVAALAIASGLAVIALCPEQYVIQAAPTGIALIIVGGNRLAGLTRR